jgi:regulator of protease activity HflC (stomatin/prohibitin superfamily)
MKDTTYVIAKLLTGLLVLALIVAPILGLMSYTRIKAGHVGVVYSISGGTKDTYLTQGVHFISPFDTVKQYPVADQQLILSDSEVDYPEEISYRDNHIDATANNGGAIKLNVKMDYSFDANKVIDLYNQYGGMDGEDILYDRLSSNIVGYIKEVVSQYDVMEIYATKKTEINTEITKYLKDKMDNYGILVKNVIVIKATPSDEVMKKIDAKVQAIEEKEKAELDQQTAIAQAETNRVKAEGEAAVKLIEAQAEAEANRIISESITQQLIDMKEAEARLEHGWVTINGASNVITDARGN